MCIRYGADVRGIGDKTFVFFFLDVADHLESATTESRHLVDGMKRGISMCEKQIAI